MMELNGGRNHAVPMSQLEDEDFDVCLPPVSDRQKIRGVGLDWLRVRVNYSYLAFVAIGLLAFLRIQRFIHWRQELVCDGYCIAIYEGAGWPEHTRIQSPGDLVKQLQIKLQVRAVSKK